MLSFVLANSLVRLQRASELKEKWQALCLL